MSILQALVLGLVQGVTEFLPISSSGFLIIIPEFLGWPLQPVAFDVVVHVATLVAIILALKDDLRQIIRHHTKVIWWVAIATLPVLFFGFLVEEILEINLRATRIVAVSFVFWGIILFLVDRFAKTRDGSVATVGWRRSVLIGFAQAIALIPGTSRSGITITAGLLGGLSRQTATTFSFLLAIPTILAAGVLGTSAIIRDPGIIPLLPLAVGGLFAFVSCYLTVRALRAWLDRRGTYRELALLRVFLGLLLLFL